MRALKRISVWLLVLCLLGSDLAVAAHRAALCQAGCVEPAQPCCGMHACGQTGDRVPGLDESLNANGSFQRAGATHDVDAGATHDVDDCSICRSARLLGTFTSVSILPICLGLPPGLLRSERSEVYLACLPPGADPVRGPPLR